MINDFLKLLVSFSVIATTSPFCFITHGSESVLSTSNVPQATPKHPSSDFLSIPLTNELKIYNLRFSPQLENRKTLEEILLKISETPSSIFLFQNLKSSENFEKFLNEKALKNIVLLTLAPLKKTVSSPISEPFFNGLLYNTTQFRVDDMPKKYYAFPGNEGIGLFCINGYPQKYRMMAKLFTHIPTEHQIAILNMDLQPNLEDDLLYFDQTIKFTIEAIQKGYETPSIVFGGNFNRPLKSLSDALITPPIDTKNPNNYSQTALLTINHFVKFLLKQRISPRISCVVNMLFKKNKITPEELSQLAQVGYKSQPKKLAEIQWLKEKRED